MRENAPDHPFLDAGDNPAASSRDVARLARHPGGDVLAAERCTVRMPDGELCARLRSEHLT